MSVLAFGLGSAKDEQGRLKHSWSKQPFWPGQLRDINMVELTMLEIENVDLP